MKRILSLILTIAMISSVVPMSIMAATEFTDVKSSDYYSNAAKMLSEQGILNGYPDGTFGAAKAITRAEMAAIVCRMISAETQAEKLKSDFTDVQDDHWAIAYIAAASEKNIINGDGDGTFRPEDDVKHEEAIKMVVCALGLAGDDIETDPADWSAVYIKIADEKGITKNLIGVKGENSTRGDVAVMVYNGIVPKVSAPTASVEAGTYTTSKTVELKCDVEGAQIYYTTDGSLPTDKSTKYTKGITVTESITLKAIAVFEGAVSDVLSIEYKISTGGTSTGGKFDFEDPDEDTSGEDTNNDETATEGPTDEEIETSNKICKDLKAAIEDLDFVEEFVEFDGKIGEVIEYIRKDINRVLSEAENGTIISNKYVRTNFADDITAVKSLVDSMSDYEYAEFVRIMTQDIATYTMTALIKHFDININYREMPLQ